MKQRIVAARRTSRRNAVPAAAVRRILEQLFVEVDSAAIREAGSLADFEGCRIAGAPQTLTPNEWRIRLKDRVFSCFGVDCDIDEPLSTLAARIDLAEHGVCCTLAH